jgi:hypothetical protein
MSSPKRAAKAGASKAVAKSAAKPRAAALGAVKPAVAVDNSISADATRLAAALEHSIVEDKLDAISAEALQKLIAAACRLYRARREAGEDFWPVPRNCLSATDVMVTASGLLKAADLAVFELGMWQNWTGR